jgi:uncharacterized RDD family membrane protein YckC
MEYEDRLRIPTPEGIELDLVLAGAASRFVAAMVDLTIQFAILIGLIGVLAAIGSGNGVVVAGWAILSFLVIFGYDVLFEVLNSGRTPGKMLNGLRVVRVTGHPVGFLTSSIRNVIRPIDFLPGGYLLGATLILSTPKNQRLGDIVAGTLVVRQRIGKSVPLPDASRATSLAPAETYRGWDTSRISPEELSAVTQFLDRRTEIEPEARVRLAGTLAERLRPKVTGVPADMGAEPFLETVVTLRRTLAP